MIPSKIAAGKIYETVHGNVLGIVLRIDDANFEFESTRICVRYTDNYEYVGLITQMPFARQLTQEYVPLIETKTRFGKECAHYFRFRNRNFYIKDLGKPIIRNDIAYCDQYIPGSYLQVYFDRWYLDDPVIGREFGNLVEFVTNDNTSEIVLCNRIINDFDPFDFDPLSPKNTLRTRGYDIAFLSKGAYTFACLMWPTVMRSTREC